MPRPEVILATGHMVDLPSRAAQRFPPGEVPRVAASIEQTLAEWDVGPGTTLVCGGARGADILAAELALTRGASVVVSLPLPLEQFVEESVAVPDDDQAWVERFRAVLARSDVLAPVDPGGDDAFGRNNDRMVEHANAIGSGVANLIAVWDGRRGDGPGGTADLVGAFRPNPERVRIIDPTARRYERRQHRPGPKKLLALDGGGVRAMLTLGILAQLEARLRDATGDPALVLADEFDYVAGTGTGAVLATGLSLGLDVAGLRRAYGRLVGKVFTRRRLLPVRFRSIHRDAPLTASLRRAFGDRTLGDPELRTLLLVVLHDVTADAPWPLSNCTGATFNRAERCLEDPSDRTLDLDLVELLRGSAAAPMYFPPQAIDVGATTVAFQDGGVTPYNNPAMLLVAMATLPEHGLCWATGEHELLLVSVGAGSAPADQSALRASSRHALVDGRKLARVFINGAATGQDRMCRSLGVCRHGPPLDSEIGDRVGAPPIGGVPLFSYARYDADLGDRALVARGIDDPALRRAVRSFDGIEALDTLWDIGTDVGRTIGTAHLAGFV